MKSMIRTIKNVYHLLVAIVSIVWFRFPSRSLTVIGITGTDGKTTTATLLYEMLKTSGYQVSLITTVHAVIAGKEYDTGFHVTTPNAFWVQKYLREAVDHGDTHMVLEVTSHALSQYRVFGIPFRVGVLTNITHEHLDWHKTFTRYVQAKRKLLAASHIVTLNRDETKIYEQLLPFLANKKIISYGMHHASDVTPQTYPFTTKLSGEFNQYNCLAALAASSALGVEKDQALRAVKDFSGIPGRMEVIIDRPFRVIVDFAHTPNAFSRVLSTIRNGTKGKIFHVFGAAGQRDQTKRPLMGQESDRYADRIFLTEEDYRTENVQTIMDDIASGISHQKKVKRCPNRNEAIRAAVSEARPGDTVIITGKGHEQSIARGYREYPWSDQEEVKKILRQLRILL